MQQLLCTGVARHEHVPPGYVGGMSEMANHKQERPVELGDDVVEGEEISPADAAERIDEDPEEQQNRHDPVWDDEQGGDTDHG